MTLTRDRDNFRLKALILGLGVLLMGLKFLAWFLTNSNAILTDALESIINILAGSFALFSLYFSARPRDRSHPYGHGKIEFISAGFEGGLIFLAGLIIIAKAGYNLWYPQPISDIDKGTILVAVCGLANFFMGLALIRRGRKNRSLVLRASGHHLQSDAYSSAGLVAGLVLLEITGLVWLDQVIAILFGGVILFTGFRLVRTSIAGILDEADHELLTNLVNDLESKRRDNWIDVHNLRLIKYGATLHLDCHLTIPWYFDTRTGHSEVKAMEKEVEDFCDFPVELFIHIDPCLPPVACAICRKADCAVREQPYQGSIPWTLQNLLQNKPHKEEKKASGSGR